MRLPKTTILLLLSLCLFIGGTLLIRPVVALRPVRAPDGGPLMESDYQANWDAYTCLFSGVILFGWAFVRGCRGSARDRKYDPPMVT